MIPALHQLRHATHSVVALYDCLVQAWWQKCPESIVLRAGVAAPLRLGSHVAQSCFCSLFAATRGALDT
jgi:hypothetical protein